MPNLGEVFTKSGVPTYTFVPPREFNRVIATLQTPGRGLVIEGPSGIGKTSCVLRAIGSANMDDEALVLTARNPRDLETIDSLLREQSFGTVVIDDFHRLPDELRNLLADKIKVLADSGSLDSRIVLIGINRAGQSLVDNASDFGSRVEIIAMGRSADEQIAELIGLGEVALTATIACKNAIVEEAQGSFSIAQTLCNEACLQANLLSTSAQAVTVEASVFAVRERVLEELETRFAKPARAFAQGKKPKPEGRAPYLHLLKWLSESPEGVLDVDDAMRAAPTLKGSVLQVVDKHFLTDLITSTPAISDLVHFDDKSRVLATEDPQFLYYIRNLIWPKFAKRIGFPSIAFDRRFDFALSFANDAREIARQIADGLIEREISVFYDQNEQARILAADVEEYLSPIYRSESQFVLALLSQGYPERIWTKFESQQFVHRFGENAVIPIWFSDAPTGLFDISRTVGGVTFYVESDAPAQILQIVDLLAQKLLEVRGTSSVDKATA